MKTRKNIVQINRRLAAAALGCVVAFALVLACDSNNGNTIEEDHAYDWPEASAASVGLNQSLIDKIEPASEDLGFMDAFLVIRHGQLVSETYHNGYDPDEMHDWQSVTKSVVGTLVGIALKQGLVDSVDQLIMDYFDLHRFADMDGRYELMTLAHLLNMTSGIAPDGTDFSIKSTAERTFLSMPVVSYPGEEFNYSGMAVHGLSIILTQVAYRSTASYARVNLCTPLGIKLPRWNADKFGYASGGSGLKMSPRDMARIGYLYLQDGKVEGQQIISERWARAVTQSPLGERAWGRVTHVGYQNLWWNGEIAGHFIFIGAGYGGQMVIGFPGLDLLVVANCELPHSEEQSDAHYAAVFELIEAYVLPGIE